MIHSGNALFVTSPVFQETAWRGNHPLAIMRHNAVVELCNTLDWLPACAQCLAAPASCETLLRFHKADYLEALHSCCASGRVSAPMRRRYNIGSMENPVFAGLFERAATTVGGAIAAARIALDGHTGFHPAGGTHHGRPDRASGFCYFNDPVFALLTLLDGGMERLLYVDLDAHHGDGVQDAFSGDGRVMTLSIHEQDRWPHSGALNDRGGGNARNMPVPPGFNDSELDFLLAEAVLPLAHRFAPQALVITCGADALAGDPLSHLELSNQALHRACLALTALVPGTVVLGGGGYNPWTTARLWTGLWGALAAKAPPGPLPQAAKDVLAGLDCDLVDEEDSAPYWLTQLADPPRNGPVRESIKQIATTVLR